MNEEITFLNPSDML